MEGTNIKLYPGFDSHGEFGRGHLVEQSRWREAWVRGLAKSYYERGAYRRPRFQLAQLRGGAERPSHHHWLDRYPHRRGHGVHAGQASHSRPSGDTVRGRARRPSAWRGPRTPVPHSHGRRPNVPYRCPRRRFRGHGRRASGQPRPILPQRCPSRSRSTANFLVSRRCIGQVVTATFPRTLGWSGSSTPCRSDEVSTKCGSYLTTKTLASVFRRSSRTSSSI